MKQIVAQKQNIICERCTCNLEIKREVDQDPELESLSDWARTIRSLVQGRIHKLKNCVNSRPKSVFKDQEAVKCLSSLHDKYVIVSCGQGFQQCRVCM